jgi:hypothetical protein
MTQTKFTSINKFDAYRAAVKLFGFLLINHQQIKKK